MARRDLYEILEVPKKASIADVKKSYKRLARKYHPDLNPNDKAAEERFKEISEAYAVLGDPEKKKKYDSYGAAWDAGADASQGWNGVKFEGFDFDGPSGETGGFSDIFESFLGAANARKATGPRQGEDLVYPVTITLNEAFTGKKIRLSIRHTVPCKTCGGEGRTVSGRKAPCRRCGGTGRIGLSKGPFSFAQPCPACHGTGQDAGDICRDCGGTGAKETTETVEASIPAGVDTGSRVRLKGKGQAGRGGGIPGDLYIETHVLPDKVFYREGPHLKVKVPVTFAEAVLGAKIEVPTLSGGAMLKIPPGTPSGQVFRLRERGMPSPRGATPGDLLVEVNVAVPAVVDERSKELLREFARLNPENPRSYNRPRGS
ncbi:MAG: J domain-containing protein [Acidobacteria bacterium]|jgi:molecular chaperone DnaJ|nr:J domain-containing protein [Acidobacteriota bacterium]